MQAVSLSLYYSQSDSVLKNVLESNKGYTKSWYNETYEGVALAHIKVLYHVDGLKTGYVQVHSQLSDWVTKINELAEPLYYQGSSLPVIEEGDFGVGVVASVDSFNWPNNQGQNSIWNDVYPTFTPYLFGIRGSVYDLQQ